MASSKAWVRLDNDMPCAPLSKQVQSNPEAVLMHHRDWSYNALGLTIWQY